MSNSLFYGLEIARRGIYASQTAFNVIGHNVSNADTKGYTRQRVLTESIVPSNSATRFLPVAGGNVGGGVNVVRIDQMRDAFLDREFRRENADMGKWETLTEQMGYIESILNETGDSGVSAILTEFFKSLSKLSQNPTSGEQRTVVQQNAINLTEAFNHYANQLTQSQSTYNDNVKATVDGVNSILENIATFNRQIFTYELSGNAANDLRDKRNLLLDELSSIIEIEYHEDASGRLIITSQGDELVNHTTANTLEVTVNATTGFYDISYEASGDPFVFESGELSAYVRLRDGATAENIGIPFILDNLDTLARSLAREFNAINEAGWTMPEGATASTQGVRFFDVPAGGYGDITAANFALSAELLASVNNIACSSVEIDPTSTDSSSQTGNNIRVLEMLALLDSKSLADVGSFEGFLNSMIGRVAIESANCETRYEGQLSVAQNLETRRQSISSVSIDEEMINMIKTQHAYAAASRVITAVDDALDVLINKTGIVGRG